MSATFDLNAKLDRLVSATADVAADVRELVSRLPSEGGMSAEEVAAFSARLDSAVSVLESVAGEYKSSDETVPDPGPEPDVLPPE